MVQLTVISPPPHSKSLSRLLAVCVKTMSPFGGLFLAEHPGLSLPARSIQSTPLVMCTREKTLILLGDIHSQRSTIPVTGRSATLECVRTVGGKSDEVKR